MFPDASPVDGCAHGSTARVALACLHAARGSAAAVSAAASGSSSCSAAETCLSRADDPSTDVGFNGRVAGASATAPAEWGT